MLTSQLQTSTSSRQRRKPMARGMASRRRSGKSGSKGELDTATIQNSGRNAAWWPYGRLLLELSLEDSLCFATCFIAKIWICFNYKKHIRICQTNLSRDLSVNIMSTPTTKCGWFLNILNLLTKHYPHLLRLLVTLTGTWWNGWFTRSWYQEMQIFIF